MSDKDSVRHHGDNAARTILLRNAHSGEDNARIPRHSLSMDETHNHKFLQSQPSGKRLIRRPAQRLALLMSPRNFLHMGKAPRFGLIGRGH